MSKATIAAAKKLKAQREKESRDALRAAGQRIAREAAKPFKRVRRKLAIGGLKT